jgi:hypothetical protein
MYLFQTTTLFRRVFGLDRFNGTFPSFINITLLRRYYISIACVFIVIFLYPGVLGG